MEKCCFNPTDILVPQGVDLTKWSVVACDQFTSEPSYWENVKALVGDAPSTLHITLPEIFLTTDDVESKIENINAEMSRYVEDGVLQAYPNSLFYIERTLRDGRIRRGILGAVDLLDYDYRKGSQSAIRATEGTVLERIPPRVRVRKKAPLELPHILLLIDDAGATVIEPLEKQKDQLEKIYDTELMQQSGHLCGYRLTDELVEKTISAICALGNQSEFEEKYGADKGVLLFAVGDGNHSLATAKECYEQLRDTMSKEEWLAHPARYALCEVGNVHEESLGFEPIHRVLFDVSPAHLLEEMNKFYKITSQGEGQKIRIVTEQGEKELVIQNPKSQLAVGSLQIFLDDYLKRFGGECDYIHGDDVVRELAAKPGNVGFLLPSMQKSELFPTVIMDGALPRKTFSMGHAWDKRFYFEARNIASQK